MADEAGHDRKTFVTYRQEIDQIDQELLRLFNQRAGCALAIGKIKKQHNLPIHVPSREEAVLKQITERNKGPLPHDAVRQIFKMLFEQMKRLEHLVEAPDGRAENS